MNNIKSIADFHKNQMNAMMTSLHGKENKAVEELAGSHDCETDNSAGNVDADGTCLVCGKTDLL